MFWIWQESDRDHLNNNDITLYFPNKGIRCYLLDLCQVNILQILSLSPSLIFRLHYSYPSKQNSKCGLHSEVVPYNFLLSGHSVLMFIMVFLLDSIRLETCSCILIKPLNDDNKNLKMWLVDILSHRLIYWNRDIYLPKKSILFIIYIFIQVCNKNIIVYCELIISTNSVFLVHSLTNLYWLFKFT